MVEPANQITEYFLGIEGEQKGPFSKDEVSAMLGRGEISEDTPLWFSGLSDWTPIRDLELFKTENPSTTDSSQNPEPDEVLKPNPKANSSLKPVQLEPTPENGKPKNIESSKTVFSNSMRFKASAPSDSKNTFIAILGLILIAAAGVYFFMAPEKKAPVVSKPITKTSSVPVRSVTLSKLQTQFNKNPSEAIPGLIELMRENPTDNEGLEALETVLSFYRRQQSFTEAGSVLMVAKKPLEALEYFLKDPPNYSQAELAYEEAFKQASPGSKRDLLLKQIDLLISPLNNIDKAVSRIKVLDKEFPSTPHPYQYYLKTSEQRIADLFSRMSFHYAETLNAFISGELSQLRFEEKPLIQIIKSKSGKYRVVATYKGLINLRNDPVSNIFFVFWLTNGQWHVVDTNLTNERAAFAKEEQKKYEADTLTAEEMLQGLETVFKTQFPGKGLHEMVTPSKKPPIGTIE